MTPFLDLTLDEHMLRHHELDLKLGDVERYNHLRGVREPIYRTSIGRWRRDLDPSQTAQLDRLLGRTLAALGY